MREQITEPNDCMEVGKLDTMCASPPAAHLQQAPAVSWLPEFAQQPPRPAAQVREADADGRERDLRKDDLPAPLVQPLPAPR